MDGISEQGLEALVEAGRRAAGESELDGALEAIGKAAAELTGADAVAIRIADEAGMLGIRTVASRSEAIAAELAGSSFSIAELLDADGVPDAVRRAGRLIHARGLLTLP